MRRKRKRAAYGFLLPSLAGVLVFYLIPFGDVVRRSFLTAVTGELKGLDNYKTVCQNEAFLLAAKNTARFALCCLPLLIGGGLLLAAVIAAHQRLKIFLTVYLLPMAVPTATVVLVWSMLFDRSGLFNGFCSRIAALAGHAHRFETDYMETDAAFWVLIISYIWKNLGYTMTLWLTGLLSVPKQLKEAAAVDGAGKGQIFWKIVMPWLLPNLYTITVLSFINSFKVFREAYLVAGSYPHESIYMLQHVFNNWFVDLSLDKMAAAAVLTGAVMITAILLLQHLWEGDEGRE